MAAPLRFVTPEGFQNVMRLVEAPTDDGRCQPFAWWFPLVLRIIWATGCRPSEVVGAAARIGAEEEEGLPRVSRTKVHHGIRARDVQEHNRIFIEGKHTTPRGRTTDLKPRVVLCADRDVHRTLREMAARADSPDANLFGLGSDPDGRRAMRAEVTKLQRRIRASQPCPTCGARQRRYCRDENGAKPTFCPARNGGNLGGFSPRWLRHGHAIAAIRAGVDLVTIQRQLGHEELTTTAIYLRYAGLDEDRLMNAFEHGSATLEYLDCPACGFGWKRDTRTGAIMLDDRVGLALIRRPAARRLA